MSRFENFGFLFGYLSFYPKKSSNVLKHNTRSCRAMHRAVLSSICINSPSNLCNRNVSASPLFTIPTFSNLCVFARSLGISHNLHDNNIRCFNSREPLLKISGFLIFFNLEDCSIVCVCDKETGVNFCLFWSGQNRNSSSNTMNTSAATLARSVSTKLLTSNFSKFATSKQYLAKTICTSVPKMATSGSFRTERDTFGNLFIPLLEKALLQA